MATPDLKFTYFDASPETLERLPELRAANPDAAFRVQTISLAGENETMGLGEMVALNTFEETAFCGVYHRLGSLDEHCLDFNELRSIMVRVRGEGEPWSVGDYALLPFRIAAGVGLATVSAGGGN